MGSEYGGLDTDPEDDGKATATTGDDEGWLHIPGAMRRKGKASSTTNDASDVDDEETQSLASSKIHAMEIGADADDDDNNDDDEAHSDDSDSDSDNTDDSEDYELTDRTPTIAQHLSGRTTLCQWRPKERLRCLALLLLAIFAAGGVALWSRKEASSSSRKPPGAVGVGHAAYDALHSSFLE
eukprot:CAMPEP_0196139854 /NCGR_PEP_ID=MMETSP0910-20130528/6982_1 /TAXON_ID=49265 /ORGANISM="Thalassiosira rotula, Strain GSO102" /LENGTH=181 /DNA_ID=CAMNT_0041400635 /DNA_START=1 /DNA_END=543 /DNA_ORIENTATION=-